MYFAPQHFQMTKHIATKVGIKSAPLHVQLICTSGCIGVAQVVLLIRGLHLEVHI